MPTSANFAQCNSRLPALRRRYEAMDRLVQWFVTEAKCTVVHRQHEIRAHLIRHLPCLLRRRVGGDVRVVGADAEDGEIYLADIVEVIAKRGVAAEQNAMVRRFDQICVESAMFIIEGARTSVSPAGR